MISDTLRSLSEGIDTTSADHYKLTDAADAIDGMLNELQRLRREVKALRKDRSRLDWLQRQGTQEIEWYEEGYSFDDGQSKHPTLRDAIDAARLDKEAFVA